MSENNEDPLLRSARREMLTSALIWLASLIWSVGYCAKYGYHLKPDELTFVFGFPSWIFWGAILPWGVCTVISGVYAFGYMQDADLGDTEEAPQSSEGDDAAE
jgi:hypothetical protein